MLRLSDFTHLPEVDQVLSDLRNSDGHMLEGDGLRQLVVSHAGKQPEEFCTALFADLAVFQGIAPQFDDMALLAVGVC